MNMTFLSLPFSFKDLHTAEGLERLDQTFLSHLKEWDDNIAHRLSEARRFCLSSLEESALLLDLSPYVEDFISQLFSIKKEVSALQTQTYALAPLFRCKRIFVQRIAAQAFSKEEAQSFKGELLKEDLSQLMGEPYSDLTFAHHVLKAFEKENIFFLEVAKKYAAWALYQDRPSVLFKLPRKINPDALIPLQKEGQVLTSPLRVPRKEIGISVEDALAQVHYCILCHPQGKDACSKGHSPTHKGCPLDQKISEMNTLRTQGYVLGALAVIMVDNPMVAATGYRICNDCMKACIFQKQDAVDIPSIETQTLESILSLPWGPEIYSLLSRWNPLNLKRPYPKKSSGYKVLVAGMGPAGFTLAHYLLNEGHRVVGVDGLKIEPLEKELLTQPVRDWTSLKEPLNQRMPGGFGGVTEYGITSRWDKNFLKLVRLLLERRDQFALFDGVRLGGTLTLSQTFDLGFDHIALCLGAGRPHMLGIPQELARGVRLASDFLMALHLTGAAQENSFANLQIRLPILVIGGGLTAVDTATEALAYYPLQVEKFLKRTEKLGGLPPSLSQEETEIAEEFLSHARAFRKGDYSILEKGSKIVYRKSLNESPSYRLNAEELKLALQQGVVFFENATPHEIKVDSYGHIESLLLKTEDGIQSLPCRTLLVATGTHPNTILEREDSHLKIEEKEDFFISYKGEEKISFFGDLHPSYQGNVVKAMASAKKGYTRICTALLKHSPCPSPDLFQKLEKLLSPRVEAIHRLTPTIIEIIIKAPQAAQNFKPGQFFRLQNYGPQAMEGLALTGANVDPKRGLLSLIILEEGGSSRLCQFLKAGERIVLMGPTGTPTEIPTGETVLLVGGGLGNAVLFSIGQALKEKHNRVLYIAAYKKAEDCFKRQEIEAVSDHVVWCCESLPGLAIRRPQDFTFEGNVIEGLLAYAGSSSPLPLSEIDRIITIGSDRMMAAVACARKTILKPYLNPGHKAVGSLNSPMQCMMKEICGQCVQTLIDPQTGKTRVVFSCASQDQDLDEIDFEVLHSRLRQNSVLEKQTRLWGETHTYE